MEKEDFRATAHQLVDWVADYYEQVETYPVKAQVKPGEVLQQLPASAPSHGESMKDIMKDFEQIILPGITHWQSPNFFAYFPSNTSPASFYGEMLMAAMGLQCMKWETSPAATELEERVMDWLRELFGLPEHFHGVIQDSASSSTLCAILAAREKYSDYDVNERGLDRSHGFRVYCSEETHSSIEKGVKVAGLGRANLRKVATDHQFAMDVDALRKAIEQDVADGYKPMCVIAAMGTTGSTAVDPLPAIAQLCREHDIWLHVDAAYAGVTLLLPEYQHLLAGMEQADSFVTNLHKWLFTHFDCSAFFLKDKDGWIKTFQVLPEYLRTKTDGQVNDYSDWGIPLGRRFRALKVWFVLRQFGVEGLQSALREHMAFAQQFEAWVKDDPQFEVTAPVNFNLVCFRFVPRSGMTTEALNAVNEKLMHALNDTGKLYLTHTKLRGVFTLRLVAGQARMEDEHLRAAWRLIREMAVVL